MIYLDQDETLKSLDKHLDSLKETVKSALLGAVLFWWAGLNQEDTLHIFGMAIPLKFALYFAVCFYLFINLSVLDKLSRIANLMTLVSDDNFMKAVSKISLHSFFANPFSYFGTSVSARLNSGKGFGVLIIIWWLCNSSLYSLSDNAMTIPGLLCQGMFLLLGLASMQSIVRNSLYILNRLKTINIDLYEEIHKKQGERNMITFVCIGIGGILAFLTMLLSFK